MISNVIRTVLRPSILMMAASMVPLLRQPMLRIILCL